MTVENHVSSLNLSFFICLMGILISILTTLRMIENLKQVHGCKITFRILTQKDCSIQFSHSVVSDSETPWIAALQASLFITNSWSLPKPMSIESVMPSSHLILCCPLLLLPPILPSIRVFSNESTLRMRWPKYWSFSFSINPSNEHPGLISFRMDWLDLLAVQGTLKTSATSQFKSINFSVLSFLHSPTLTSIHEHWKNHSLDKDGPLLAK